VKVTGKQQQWYEFKKQWDLEGGTSFMEDYTYHFTSEIVCLGSHMLEICPSIADGKPSCK
jgi:L-arabinose isomerase